MLETIEELGNWWIPESPDQKLTGTVTFDPQKGVSLDLVGCFEGSRDAHNSAEYPVIHGLTKTGPISLSRCQNGGWIGRRTPHGGEFITSRYHADRLFRGMHFPDPEHLTLNELHLSFTHLHAWIGEHRLEIDHSYAEDEGETNVISYRSPQSIDIELDDVSYEFWSDFAIRESIDNLILDGNSGVVLTSQSGLTLEQWSERVIYPLFEFLSFATGRANGLSKVRFEQAYSQEELAGWPPKEVDVVFLLSANMRFSGTVLRSPRLAEDLVYARELEKDGASIYASWLSVSRQFHSAVRLYLLARDFGDRFPFFEAQFVGVLQALESYHRQKHGNEDSKGKRIYLKARLTELFNETHEIVKEIHGNQALFIDRLVDSRDYFTHLSEAMGRKRFNVEETYNAMRGLLCVLEVLILKELGLSREESVRRVKKSQRFLAIRRIS